MQLIRQRPLARPVAVGAVAGVVHALVVGTLWIRFGFEDLVAALPDPYAAYAIAGMLAVGFVPGFCYARYGTASPLAVVTSLLALAGYGTWRTIGSGATPVDPTPLGWYVLLWVAVAAVAALAAGAEARFARSPETV